MFDVIVIGAGSGGLTSGLGLAGVGKKVLLIEKHKMGGDCTNYGCIPSKSLIKYGKEASLLKKYGYDFSDKESTKAMEGTRMKVEEILGHESPEVLMKKYSTLKVVKGEAKFLDRKTVEVNGVLYTGRKIIIATGSEPRVIKIKGLKDEDLLTNKSVFDLKNIPKNLLIVGGGVIACELGEAFANLGSKVKLVVRGNHILKGFEPEISKNVLENLQKKGVKVLLESSIELIEGNEAIIAGKKHSFDKVLMAVGRVVNTEGLQLEKAGVKFDKHGIKVDRKNRTSAKGIYALGDVASPVKLTHNADHQGRNVVKDILIPFYNPKKKALPKVVFMENEIAAIGMGYDEALAKYSESEIFKIELDLNRVDRSLTDETNGKLILVLKGLRGKILGANIYGPRAGEMIGMIGLAIDNKINLHKLSSSIYAYPTYSRIFKKAGDDFLRLLASEWKNYLKAYIVSRLPKVFAILFWLSLIIGFVIYKNQSGLSNLDMVKAMYNFTVGTMYGPLVYIIVYTLRPIIFFPGTPLTLASGALFGPIWGSIYTIIGANLSANVAYGIGRFTGGNLIEEGESFIGRWKTRLKENSFESVMIMRLIYLPFDGVNYACGILKVRWFQYALATFVGILPGIVTFVSFGSSIENLNEFELSMIEVDGNTFAISIGLFVASLVLARFVRNKYKTEKA